MRTVTLGIVSWALACAVAVGCNREKDEAPPGPAAPRLDDTLRAGIPSQLKFGVTTLTEAQALLASQGLDIKEIKLPAQTNPDERVRRLNVTPTASTQLPHGAKELRLKFLEHESGSFRLTHASLSYIEDAPSLCDAQLKELDSRAGSMSGCKEPRTLETFWVRCAASEDGNMSLAIGCDYGETRPLLSIGTQD